MFSLMKYIKKFRSEIDGKLRCRLRAGNYLQALDSGPWESFKEKTNARVLERNNYSIRYNCDFLEKGKKLTRQNLFTLMFANLYKHHCLQT